MPPPPCGYASKPGSLGSCTCPMIAKFGFCAFLHPPDDFRAGSQVSAVVSEPSLKRPEVWMAQLSSPVSILEPRPSDGQRVRLLRHNCEREIGWSYVQTEDGGSGVCREGLVASVCVGLPLETTAGWEPPTYGVDTHKPLSVFKQASTLFLSLHTPVFCFFDVKTFRFSGSLLISGLSRRQFRKIVRNQGRCGKACRFSTCHLTSPSLLKAS